MAINNLFEFSAQFEKSLGALKQNSWAILRLKQLNQLVIDLESSVEKVQQPPFRLELDGIANMLIPDITSTPENTGGMDPDMLQDFHEQFSLSITVQDRRELEFLIIDKLFNLGAVDKLESFLEKCDWFGTGKSQDLQISTNNLISFKRSFLAKYADHLPSDLNARLDGSIKTQQSGSSNTKVQGMFVVEEGGQKSGVLADLSLTRLKTSKKQGVDQLRISTHLVDEDDTLADQGHDLFTWLRSNYYDKIGGHLRVEYTLTKKSSLIRGSSLGLGLGMLGHMALYGLDKNRSFEPRIYDDVAITGALGPKGDVRPVNEETLRSKLEVCFFSHVNTLVLPAQNQPAAEQLLSELQAKFPLRQLRTIFLTHIDEIESYKEFFFYQRRRVSQRTSQFIREYANFVTVSTMLFILVLGIGFWLGVVKHPVPANTINYPGSRQVSNVVNKYGFSIWEPPERSYTLVSKTSFANGGKVITGFNRHASKHLNGYLFCFDNDFKEIWKVHLVESLKFGDNAYSEFYNIIPLEIKDFNHDGDYELVVLVAHNYFPRKILVLNEDGEILSHYYHSGSVPSLLTADIVPGNQTEELIFAGVNNEYGGAILFILDPFNTEGASPQENKFYILEGVERGNELAYMRFPKTEFQTRANRDAATSLGIVSGNLNVGVYNHSRVPEKKILVNYHLDQNLSPTFIGITDNYIRGMQTVFPEFTSDDSTAIKRQDRLKSVLYWSGESWETTPTLAH